MEDTATPRAPLAPRPARTPRTTPVAHGIATAVAVSPAAASEPRPAGERSASQSARASRPFPVAHDAAAARAASPSSERTAAEHRALVRKRAAVIACLAGITVVLAALCVRFGPELLAFVGDASRFRAWVDETGALGRVLFVAANTAQIVFAFLPGEPLELAAGYAFGFWEGTLWCLVSSALGTAIVMLLVRAFGMRVVGLFFPPEKITSMRWLRDARRFELLLFLVFLIPGTPKDLLTYVAGLGSSPVWRIVALTAVGRTPSVVSSTLAAGALGDGNYGVAAVTVAVTLVLVGAGVLAYRRLAKQQDEAAEPIG